MGTGFICEIEVKSIRRFGLVTNNHVIKNLEPIQLKKVKLLFKKLVNSQDENEIFYLNDENIGELRVSYSDIDAAFIEFSEKFRKQLQNSQRQFLEIDTMLKESDGILMIQYPALSTGQKLSYAMGQIIDSDLVWDIPPCFELHSAPAMPGSSGSPLLLMSQKVYAIHTGASRNNNHNMCVRIEFLIGKLNGKTIGEIMSAGCLKLNSSFINCYYKVKICVI